MGELLCHLWGDFMLQNDWMGLNKKLAGRDGYIPCTVHVVIYASCFLFTTTFWMALLIGLTHYVIDRGHLVEKYIGVTLDLV